MSYEKNDVVEWEWGNGKAFGEITSVHTSKVTKTIDGSEVTRDASQSEPAYYIKQIDGDSRVLKSHSELSKVNKDTVYELAKEKEVEGRSDMSKDELISAVK